jgi:hypothetical protein
VVDFLQSKVEGANTFLTTGNTHGFALSSLYAPIPRSTFFSSVSFRYAAISPKRGSSGAWGTASIEKLVGVDCDICADMLVSLEFGEEEVDLFEEEVGDAEKDEGELLLFLLDKPLLA